MICLIGVIGESQAFRIKLIKQNGRDVSPTTNMDTQERDYFNRIELHLQQPLIFRGHVIRFLGCIDFWCVTGMMHFG